MAQPDSSEQVAVQRRTTLVSIAAAGLLVILKLGVGLIAGSLALISAGIESSGDVVAAILTFFAVRLGRQPADPEHPYGHARAENLGALGEAGILLAGGLIVAVEAIKHLLSPSGTPDTHHPHEHLLGSYHVRHLSRWITAAPWKRPARRSSRARPASCSA
jgi:cation diffusion facilitator family transporter